MTRKILAGLLALTLAVSGLSSAGVVLVNVGSGSTPSASDTTPDAFSFTDQTGVATSSTITSAPVTITGINASTTCNASAGTIDKNSSGTFAASQSVVSSDTLRARHTSSASNSTAVNTVVDCNGVSDTFTSTTTSGASGVFFNPDVDSWSGSMVGAGKFDDQNNTPFAVLDTTVFRPGHTQSIRLDYTADEDGTDLILTGESLGGTMPATDTLFVRTYEYYDAAWEGNWPQGLKTARIFTRPDVIGCNVDPYNVAYVSEKIIFPGYETSPDPRIEDYVVNGSWAYCNREPELASTYTSEMLFGNGLPYLRTGHWYKWERWYVINSADEAADGVLQVWIDDVLVLSLTNVVYRSSSSGADNPSTGYGTQWMSMWIGGNHSNTGTFTGGTKRRYISDPYFSTTLDR